MTSVSTTLTGLAGVPHHGDDQGDPVGGRIEAEAAVGIGLGELRAVLYLYGGPGEGLAVVVFYGTANGFTLRQCYTPLQYKNYKEKDPTPGYGETLQLIHIAAYWVFDLGLMYMDSFFCYLRAEALRSSRLPRMSMGRSKGFRYSSTSSATA